MPVSVCRQQVGNFFRKFPRHRQLISINKRHTGRGGSGLAVRPPRPNDILVLLSADIPFPVLLKRLLK